MRYILLYCLFIWLAGVLLGPLVWYLSPTFVDNHVVSFGRYYLWCLEIGSVLLAVILLLSGVLMMVLNRVTVWASRSKKWVISIWILLLIIPSYVIVFDADWSDFTDEPRAIVAAMLAYLLPMMGVLFLLRWPIWPKK